MRYITVCVLLLVGFTQVAVANDEESLHLNWRDLSVQPSEDFYRYANGVWQKENPIPPEYSSWSHFRIVNDMVLNSLRQILTEASHNTLAKPGSVTQLVGDFYYSGMDLPSINALGAQPLAREFARIDAIQNQAQLQEAITHLQLIGVDALFSVTSMQDFKNSQEMIGAVFQGGLGLPDRDYYLKDDPKFNKIRTEYVHHIGKMFELLGETPEKASKDATRILFIETILAKASMSQTAQRDPYAVYHMMDRKQLATIMPHFDWPHFFQALNLSNVQHINLGMPEFFKTVNNQLVEIPLADWKLYLRWHLIDAFASYLSQPFVDQNFWMTTVLSGNEKLLPRWKRVVNTVNDALAFALGKLYVEKYFPAQSKQAVLAMVDNIRQALRKDLLTITWMSPETRKAALQKLDLMEARVGYPDTWRDYSKLKIDRGPYVLNVIRTNVFFNRYELNKIGKPVDRNEWAMSPQTINAYYDPSMNNLTIPAGILQAPFYDPHAPAAINYGAIGFVIGHEITHGFDNQGSKFDGYGNLRNWWTPDDAQRFDAATQCIVNQFSHYTVDGDFPLQGKLVAGEATADLGGLTLAYRAFQASQDFSKAKTLQNLSPSQQFFLSAAHLWASNVRPKQARALATTDPHPPSQYRVNGTLVNMPEFIAAFGAAKLGSIIKQTPCVIW